MRKLSVIGLAVLATSFVACKKGCPDEDAVNYDPDAKKDDGSCVYEENYDVPTTYSFSDDNGNSTVSYSGQTDRLNQMEEMTTYMKSGVNATVDAQALKDMFANTGDDGNGNFSFSSSKQLENKCFELDTDLYKEYMDSVASASLSNGQTASNGQAGTITSNDGSSTYLLAADGKEYVQLVEKGIMGAVFMYQALNVYFGTDKMDVDNTEAEDPNAGKYYTAMEHHFDEAFGYFGAPTDFPSNTNDARFWGKYCNSRDAELGSNALMMDNFLKGRAAISNDDLDARDEAIETIRETWELLSAAQAVYYYESALSNINDQAKYFHYLSEAFAFTQNLRYAPTETKKMTTSEVNAILASFDNLWDVTTADINDAITTLEGKYNL